MKSIINAQKSCAAFEKPGLCKPRRGWSRKKGTTVHLWELFVSHKEQFQEAEIELYGKKESYRAFPSALLGRLVPSDSLLKDIFLERVSEAALIYYFRKHFFRLLGQMLKSCITHTVQRLQEDSENRWSSRISEWYKFLTVKFVKWITLNKKMLILSDPSNRLCTI